jgi:hypothetical protein
MPTRYEHSRSRSTQPYRTTDTAQQTARRIQLATDGRAVTLRPLADVLSPRTRATLAAIVRQNGGR